jgi:hypothetical protein
MQRTGASITSPPPGRRPRAERLGGPAQRGRRAPAALRLHDLAPARPKSASRAPRRRCPARAVQRFGGAFAVHRPRRPHRHVLQDGLLGFSSKTASPRPAYRGATSSSGDASSCAGDHQRVLPGRPLRHGLPGQPHRGPLVAERRRLQGACLLGARTIIGMFGRKASSTCSSGRPHRCLHVAGGVVFRCLPPRRAGDHRHVRQDGLFGMVLQDYLAEARLSQATSSSR